MTNLVKMRRDDGLVADVHPDMVDDYFRNGGYVVVNDGIRQEKEAQEEMSGKDLADALRALGVESIPRSVGDRRALLASLQSDN